jgi:hypothetical protein
MKKEKPEFTVVPWLNCHGVETFFMVMDQDGFRHGVFPSEWEAIAAAAQAGEAAAKATEAAAQRTEEEIMADRQEEMRKLELTIAINEMLPPERQCKDFIAEQRAKLAHLQRPLELVRENNND